MRLKHFHMLFSLSFIAAVLLVILGGFHGIETEDNITLVANLSATMAGFGLVAFQIARVSNELRNDFIESSILMILATITGFFYLVYPERSFLSTNFGEISIFVFFWAFILFLLLLIDKRFKLLT